MNAQDDESLDSAPPPPPKPTFDRAKAQRLLNTASRYGRIPGSDFIAEIADQLRLALGEIDGSQAKIDRAQAEQLQAVREAEAANAEAVLLRREVLALKTKPAEAPKKRGPRAKLIPIATQPEQQKAAQ